MIGRKIVGVRPMRPSEIEAKGWVHFPNRPAPVVIILDDGSSIYAASDHEGNGPGALFGADAGGKHVAIMAHSDTRPIPGVERRVDESWIVDLVADGLAEMSESDREHILADECHYGMANKYRELLPRIDPDGKILPGAGDNWNVRITEGDREVKIVNMGSVFLVHIKSGQDEGFSATLTPHSAQLLSEALVAALSHGDEETD